MQTITIDIINDKAVNLLRDLELMQLIRMRREKSDTRLDSNLASQYKGGMQKQPLNEIDNQINDLRNTWE